MGRIEIRKYGGSSLAENHIIESIIDSIQQSLSDNQDLKIIVAVSARGNTTDNLFAQAKPFYTARKSDPELALLAATGEIQSASIFSMALSKRNISAKVLLPSNIPVLVENDYLEGRIKSIKKEKILENLKKVSVLVIPGYQGVDLNGDVALLGRGGTDTTAVAVAAALGVEECNIYSDVDGVYTGDPRVIEKPLKIDHISYDEMKEMAISGAKVLHYRAVEIARRYNIKVKCLSTFIKNEGTTVGKVSSMEEYEITGLVHKLDEARIEILNTDSGAEAMYKLFAVIDNLNVPIDMLTQVMENNKFNVCFTMPKSLVLQTVSALEKLKNDIKFEKININVDIVKISVIGERLRNNTQAAVRIMRVLKENNARIFMVNYSDIKMSFVIPAENFRVILEKLHCEFFK
ncbi:MAG: aspartate kinase [Candidatus Muiribacteriota bacterium]